MRSQAIFHNLYFTLHCAHILKNVVLTTVIEMDEILDGRVGKNSVEQESCNKQLITLSHCEIWSHFTGSLFLHSPLARKILRLLMKLLVILHADPCNKSYLYVDAG